MLRQRRANEKIKKSECKDREEQIKREKKNKQM